MRTHKCILALTLSALAIMLAGAAVASATAFNTNLRFNRYSLGFFYGVVKSSQPKCKARQVALFVKGTPPNSDMPIGGVKSSPNGHWSIVDGHGLGGDYYAKVKDKRIKINGKSHLCKADTSNVFTR